MPRRPRTPEVDRLAARLGSLDDATIDTLYGLEPVYEPGGDAGAALGAFAEFLCPYCGEHIGTAIDLTEGSRSHIEDCQVCCRPMLVAITVDDAGELAGVDAFRSD